MKLLKLALLIYCELFYLTAAGLCSDNLAPKSCISRSDAISYENELVKYEAESNKLVEALKKKYRAIVFDIDETLADANHIVPDEVIDHIASLISSGIYVVLVSGRVQEIKKENVERGIHTIEEVVAKVRTKINNDKLQYLLCFGENGAMGVNGFEVQDPKRRTYDLGVRKMEIRYKEQIFDELAAMHPGKLLYPEHKEFGLAVWIKEEFRTPEFIKSLAEDAKRIFESKLISLDFDVVCTPVTIDIHPKGVKKENTLRVLAEFFNIPEDCVATIGDKGQPGWNDHSMLERKGGFCVGDYVSRNSLQVSLSTVLGVKGFQATCWLINNLIFDLSPGDNLPVKVLDNVSGFPAKLIGNTIEFGDHVVSEPVWKRPIRDAASSTAEPGLANGPEANKIIYYGVRNVRFKNDTERIDKLKLRFDVSVTDPGYIGNEIMVTKGHIHPGPYPEIYEVWNGYALYIQQHENASGVIDDIIVTFAKPGDKVLIYPGYFHRTINIGSIPLVHVNWICDEVGGKTGVSPAVAQDFSSVEQRNGFAVRLFRNGPAGAVLEHNTNWKIARPLQELIRFTTPCPVLSELGLNEKTPMYNIINDQRTVKFLSDYLRSASSFPEEARQSLEKNAYTALDFNSFIRKLHESVSLDIVVAEREDEITLKPSREITNEDRAAFTASIKSEWESALANGKFSYDPSDGKELDLGGDVSVHLVKGRTLREGGKKSSSSFKFGDDHKKESCAFCQTDINGKAKVFNLIINQRRYSLVLNQFPSGKFHFLLVKPDGSKVQLSQFLHSAGEIEDMLILQSHMDPDMFQFFNCLVGKDGSDAASTINHWHTQILRMGKGGFQFEFENLKEFETVNQKLSGAKIGTLKDARIGCRVFEGTNTALLSQLAFSYILDLNRKKMAYNLVTVTMPDGSSRVIIIPRKRGSPLLEFKGRKTEQRFGPSELHAWFVESDTESFESMLQSNPDEVREMLLKRIREVGFPESELNVFDRAFSDKIKYEETIAKIITIIKNGADDDLTEIVNEVKSEDELMYIIDELNSVSETMENGLQKARAYQTIAYIYGNSLNMKQKAEYFDHLTFEEIEKVVKTSIGRYVVHHDVHLIKGADVTITAPVRIEFDSECGSDIVAMSLEKSGRVINTSVRLKGQDPIQVKVKSIPEKEIRIQSVDLHKTEVIKDKEQLQYKDPGDNLRLVKAALFETGIIPEDDGRPLQEILSGIGGGLEIETDATSIPLGSGLGVSSSLGSAVIAGLLAVTGEDREKNIILAHALNLEQRLGVGGGWQDPVGGIFGGFKYIHADSGCALPEIDKMPIGSDIPDKLKNRMVLLYLGQGHYAGDILKSLVRDYLLRKKEQFEGRKRNRIILEDMSSALTGGDLNKFGKLLSDCQRERRIITGPMLTTDFIEHIFEQTQDLALGARVSGAGGGGFMILVAREGETEALKERLNGLIRGTEAEIYDYDFDNTGLHIEMQLNAPFSQNNHYFEVKKGKQAVVVSA